VKRKRLGYFLKASRTTPWRGGSLYGRSNPDGRSDVVDRLVRLGKIDATRDAATLSQGEARGLIGLIGRWHFPKGGRGRGERKGRRAWKERRDLGEGKNAGLGRSTSGDGGRPHRARSGKRLVLGGSAGRGRRTLERDTVVVSIVVVPPFTDGRCTEPSDEHHVVLGKLVLVKFERNDKAEAVPLELLRTALTSCKSTDRITYSPRPREGRREMIERAYVLAEDLGSGLPVVEGKPESNMLLESNVADEDRAVESSRPGPRERQTLDVDVGMEVGGVGEWSGLIGVDDWERTLGGEGGWAGRLWEGIR